MTAEKNEQVQEDTSTPTSTPTDEKKTAPKREVIPAWAKKLMADVESLKTPEATKSEPKDSSPPPTPVTPAPPAAEAEAAPESQQPQPQEQPKTKPQRGVRVRLPRLW